MKRIHEWRSSPACSESQAGLKEIYVSYQDKHSSGFEKTLWKPRSGQLIISGETWTWRHRRSSFNPVELKGETSRTKLEQACRINFQDWRRSSLPSEGCSEVWEDTELPIASHEWGRKVLYECIPFTDPINNTVHSKPRFTEHTGHRVKELVTSNPL